MLRPLVLLATLAACSPSAPTPDSAAPAADPPAAVPVTSARQSAREYWPTRTDAELDAAFDEVCAESKADGKPVLLAFSAPWCPDCRRLKGLSEEGPLRAELDRWHTLVIDPGRFDQHVPVLQAFGVSAIVRWVAARPEDCRMPAPGWPRLREGTFEPETGQPWSAEQLAAWLKEARS